MVGREGLGLSFFLWCGFRRARAQSIHFMHRVSITVKKYLVSSMTIEWLPLAIVAASFNARSGVMLCGDRSDSCAFGSRRSRMSDGVRRDGAKARCGWSRSRARRPFTNLADVEIALGSTLRRSSSRRTSEPWRTLSPRYSLSTPRSSSRCGASRRRRVTPTRMQRPRWAFSTKRTTARQRRAPRARHGIALRVPVHRRQVGGATFACS